MAAALLVLCALQGSDEAHRRVYEKVRRSVVALRALAPLGERSGTGSIVSADGLILTSYSVVPAGSTRIRVWTAGPRRYDAELVGTSERDEVSLLRIKPKEPLPAIEYGESGRARIGQIAYTIGNAANSIILDDQPSLNVGVVSGLYKLTEKRANSTYAGLVIETTAAVNVGMEGAPLLDSEGRMIGFVTQNYSPHRFLGAAIPIDSQKYAIQSILRQKSTTNDPPKGEGTLGLKARDDKGRVVVTETTRGGAADRAGIRPGDVLLAIGRAKIRTCEELWKRVEGLKAGDVVILTVEAEGDRYEVKIELTGK